MKKMIFLFLVTVSVILTFPIKIHADNTNGDSIGFVVKAVIPETQIQKDKTYFTPWIKPGEDQVIKVQVISTRKEPITIQCAVKNGTTNRNGEIQYVNSGIPLDPTLKMPVSDIVTPKESEVTVENFEIKVLSFQIHPSKEFFKGVKLGALNFSESNQNKKGNNGVTNNYGYNIGIVLSEDKTNPIGADKLNFQDVSPKLVNGRRGVAAKLQNPTPYIMDNMAIKTEWCTKNRKKILRSENKRDLRMAPNSNFDFVTYWGIEDLVPGEYSLHIIASSNDKKWDWWKDFEITDGKAKALNTKAGYHLTLPPNFKLYIWIIGIFSFISIVGTICTYNFDRKKKIDQRRNK